jgi:SAM-dependent methyltransferase
LETGIAAFKRIYRFLVPASIRQSRTMVRLKGFVFRILPHEWVYNADFFSMTVRGPAVQSALAIATSIINDLGPRTVIDVGCGIGALLEVLKERGCTVRGIDYADYALGYCRSRGLDVLKLNLECDAYPIDETFDVAVSMEVAEHLPASAADRFVDLLVSLSPCVVFTAAPPGPGGRDHVNEQPFCYWIAKFSDRGYWHDEQLTEKWREEWRQVGTVAHWYYRNLMVFRRSPSM